jgi:hypothetical protein
MACEECHRPASWTAVAWNHASQTGVPLNTAHQTLGCDACHKNALFTGVDITCGTCHQKDYDRTTAPNHLAAGFPTDCALCHRASDESFTQGRFDHNSTYPLVGVHATAGCAACHGNGVYQGTPTSCVGCHKADYDRTTAPNHAAAGFPTTCETCHQANAPGWTTTTFNHSQYYALVGVHATVACMACHVSGVYQGTPTSCVGCHKADYDKTTSPNHAASGFSTQCDTCHKATDPSWTAASFNHSQYYALVGVHATVACTACHINGVYKGTPTDCYSCHKTQYDQTTNPNHAASGFPTTCDSCHKASDSSWTQATFTHSWFPITSGAHSGHPCSACHTDPSNYAVFTCTTCHDRTSTDSHHHGVSGYVYDSNACYACHPNGRGGLPLERSHVLTMHPR